MAKKILIVEDNREISNLLMFALKAEGYKIIQCFTGTEALQKMSETLADLIILDVMLPDTTGFQLLKVFKNKYHIPILMCTDRNLIKDVDQAMSDGADGYITKPFELDRVIEKVKAAVSI